MNRPVFFLPDYDPSLQRITLKEDTSKHIVQVLRMRPGDQLQLTNGKGILLTAEIIDDHKKKCLVQVNVSDSVLPATRKITIAISLLKNINRFEWFLEKATEIGVSEIIPLICQRTEKQKFRLDRMQNILISAMLQSQQCWFPQLHEPVSFQQTVEQSHHQQKFIAHCIEEEKRNLADLINSDLTSQIILIGPEGDFAKEEIDLAIRHHFIAVTLGETRLRSETAGLVAAAILRIT